MMKRNLIKSAFVFLLVLALLTVPAVADNGEEKGVFHGPLGEWRFADDDWNLDEAIQYGQPGDIPIIVGEVPAVFRNGVWIFIIDEDWNPTPEADRPQLGQLGDIPIVVDGKPGVFLPASGVWIFAEDEDWNPTPEAVRPQLGQLGDIPIVVDGKPGVFRPADGTWIFAEDEDWNPTPVADRPQFGQMGDIPIVVDGKPGVYRDGTWIFAEDEDWNPTPFADRPQFGDAGDWPFAGIITPPPPPPEPLVITTIVAVEDSFDVPYGTSLADAIALLEAEAAYEGVVDNPGTVPVVIEDWTSATYGPEAEGDHTFTGQPIAPEGYVFADCAGTEVSATVTVGARPDDKIITQVNPQSDSVERDTPKADIDFPAKAVVKAATTWYSLDVEWDDESTPVYNGFVPGDYVFEGKLINLPDYVTNPDNLRAVFTVTVEDTVFPETAYVSTYQQFQAAIDNKTDRIILEADITLEGRERIEYDLKLLDLSGYTITLKGGPKAGPLAFLGDGTTVKNGKIVGNVTWWSLNCSEVDDVWGNGTNAYAWQTWQHENKVMISGKGITFDNIVFEVDVADWYQTQSDRTYGTTSGLTIRNSALYGVSLFNSDVYITRTDVYNRIGIEHNDALLNEVEYKVNNKLILYEKGDVEPPGNTAQYVDLPPYCIVQPSVGIVYVNSDATLLNNKWNAGRAALPVVVVDNKGNEQELVKTVTVDYDYATGMFVGKSLKYYGTYSQAEPRLNGARIDSDKYAYAWWALNYEKARLWTAGEIVVISQEGRGGLVLVGTDSRDYPDSKDSKTYEGGQIRGTGTFTGAAVYIGKPTIGYALQAGYPGAKIELPVEHPELPDWYYKKPWCAERTRYDDFTVDIIHRDKYGKLIKIVPIPVDGSEWCDTLMLDCQACKKDADRLFIDGPIFVSPAYIFTPANEYIGCTERLIGCRYHDTVELSDPEAELNFNNGINDDNIICRAPLDDPVWFGDLTFGKIQLWGDFDIVRTKTVTFDEIKVMCGNIRRIGTEKELEGTHQDCVGWDPFSHGGTLTGGTIVSDTKDKNVLVLGDGLTVRTVVLDKTLYNVILEYAWLEDVTMNVGDGNRNDNRDPPVCGDTLENGDIFVWQNNMATMSNSMFSTQTRIVVKDDAALTLVNKVDNRGILKFEPEAGLYFDNANLYNDIRDACNVDIRVSGGRVYIDVDFSLFANHWSFKDWKLDMYIQADDRIISTKYRLDWLPLGERKIEIQQLNETVTDRINLTGQTQQVGDKLILTLNRSTWFFDYSDPEEWAWDLTGGAYVRDILGVGHKHAFPPLIEDYQYGGELRLRLSAATDKTFDLTVRVVGINCCTRELIEFGTDGKEVKITKKFDCDEYNTAIRYLTDKGYLWPIGHDEEGNLDNPNAFWLFGWKWPGRINYDGYIITPPDKIEIKPPEKYTLTVDSTEGGSVTEPGEGSFTYDEGDEVDLTAVAEEGYRFTGWTGDTDNIDDADSASTFITMNADATITAEFEPDIGDFSLEKSYFNVVGGQNQIRLSLVDDDGTTVYLVDFGITTNWEVRSKVGGPHYTVITVATDGPPPKENYVITLDIDIEGPDEISENMSVKYKGFELRPKGPED